MHKEFRGLTFKNVLDFVEAMTNSEYFLQHELKGDSSLTTDRLESNFGSYKPLGGWFTLADLMPDILPQINRLRTNKVGLEHMTLNLYASMGMKTGFGFSEDRAEDLGMCVSMSVIKSDASSKIRYNVMVFQHGLDKDKYANQQEYRIEQKMYGKWERQVKTEIRKACKKAGMNFSKPT